MCLHLRVLRVHNRYQQRGGEDVSFESECLLLERMGHRVSRLEFTNDDIPTSRSMVYAVKLAGNTVWSRSARQKIGAELEAFQPDIVHFDNTFPLISPAVYGVVKKRGIAVVQSLRNYRLICPSAVLFHDGMIYEDNVGKLIPWRAVRDQVYRDSYLQTAVVALMLVMHRLMGTWQHNVDRYIALTETVKRKHIVAGFQDDKVVVKPNFVNDCNSGSQAQRSGFLYVGRLSQEKGVGTLFDAVQQSGRSLTVIGDGDEGLVDRASASEYSYLGRLPEQETYTNMASSTAVICPSEWYEPFGRVVVEAFAVSTPVIASRLGGLEEIIEDGVTGLLFEPGNVDDLAAKITWAAEHPEEMRRMGENARREYVAKYTPERNYEMLMDIYQQAINHADAYSN